MQDFEVKHADGLIIYVFEIFAVYFPKMLSVLQVYSFYVRLSKHSVFFTEITITITLLCCDVLFFPCR